MRRWLLATLALAASAHAQGLPIICPSNAPPQVKLAAKEIRRYVYLRTGHLQPCPMQLRIDPSLGAQEYRITADTIAGGSGIGVLYGAYRYAELLGVRFYLHGDVIPDGQLKELPSVKEESGKPLFALRGVNPWGSHPFGFDAWSADDYKAVITQLAKMRMNFIGMHCYPEGHPYAEPTVWHGLSDDFDARGRVKSSYVTRYFNTLLPPAWGGYLPKKTSDYGFGGALLFERDDWAPPVMEGHCPLPQTPEECNDVFNRMGEQFGDAFSFAKRVGVKTCLGTEAPLILPKALAQRTSDVRAVYEGTFRRIMASHPLDYYWIWTPESWTWSGNKPAQYSNTVADIKLASEALKHVKAPFQLATCGWVLGPQHDRAAFDRDLPKGIPMSAISRNTGADAVDPAFGRISGREMWAIPWLESDNREGLAGVQLFAGRMRRDAVDALTYGCTGLMGLHWRTDNLAPNASALASAAWDQSWYKGAAWTVSGQVADYPAAAITGTQDAPLYRSCRYDLGTIRLKAPDGRYRVTLKFCEPHFDKADERIFDVKVQGNAVLTNLDIFAKVGKFAALDYTFDDVVVADGTVTVELVARKSLPCLSAIAVEGAGFTSKINLGGAAHNDWQADAGKPRYLPVEDFYADWAQANFGLAEAGRVFAAMDGKIPMAGANDCPAMNLPPDGTPWGQVAPQYAFVDEFAALRPQIKGAGNLDRFDYWQNTFKHYRALAKTRCAMGAKNPDEVMKCWTEAYTCLLATVCSPGTLAMVVNMENKPGTGPTVANFAGKPFPKEYQGQARLIVPTVRSVIAAGESLVLKPVVLANGIAESVVAKVRPLGRGDWVTISAMHVARGVWKLALPAALDDYEYRIEAKSADGKKLVWPATAPAMNQTVVVTE